MIPDAECVKMVSTILKALDLGEFEIKVSKGISVMLVRHRISQLYPLLKDKTPNPAKRSILTIALKCIWW